MRALFQLFLPFFVFGLQLHAIMAGDEFAWPQDRPSWRLDALGVASPYSFVGALEVEAPSGGRWLGTGTALSPHWVLTAGHNVDLNDNGRPEPGLLVRFHLPGMGTHTASQVFTAPDFTGFGNPSTYHDLALLYFDDPLPRDLPFPNLGGRLEIGTVLTLVGFGRSGYGNYGYTTAATMTDRRVGWNTVDSLTFGPDGDSLLFRYTFDGPDSPLSLGNDRESIIGPGDSGGPALIGLDDVFFLAGLNTFTEGYGGRFGDIGGGIVLEPYWDWIHHTTGLGVIPEPAGLTLIIASLAFLTAALRRRLQKER